MSRSKLQGILRAMSWKSSSLAVVLLAPVLCGLLSGCGLVRFKGVESFESATTLPTEPRTLKGDPGASGGIAMASGGNHAKTLYGDGASLTATAPLVPTYDQPAKGSGNQPGENPVEAAPGYGHDNGPAFQNPPGEANSTSTLSKQ